uniref:Replicase polyprotein 1a n=1 Tax=Corethron hystrix TaxID=216773 RepID=A0A7S1FXE5_9STRA|mmetsp:Transcript_35198/g.81393  ORF Transcript_35198/g.81393 Transcript_35198/m.81393 type:complete len:400 (+) Transcript_35198:168-1367(+)
MRWTKAAAFFFALCVGSNYVAASFTKDVISGSSDERRRVLRRKELHNIILKYAQPLSGHPQESKLRASFGDSSRTLPSFMARRLDEEDDAINFDIAEYSLKFSKCQTIKSYSDDAVEEGYEDVLVAQNFVVFRLCPTQSCSSSSNLGCKQDYGEYIMMLADYLEIMNEYLENRKEAYCDFCADCFDNDDEERRRLKNHRRKLEEADQDEDQDEDENNEEADDEQADDDEEDNDDNADNDDGGDNDEDDDEEDNDDENDDGDNDGEGDDDEQNEDEEDDDANDDEDDENDDDEENDDEEDDEEDDDQDEDDYVAAGDDNVNGDDGNNYCNVCGDYDTYAAKCEDEDRDDDYGNAAVEYADWFECTQIDIDDGLERYGMATCAEDTGYAIAIKLFFRPVLY